MAAKRRDWTRLVPGVYRRFNKFEASVRIAGVREYLGTFERQSLAEDAVIARRSALGVRPTRYAA